MIKHDRAVLIIRALLAIVVLMAMHAAVRGESLSPNKQMPLPYQMYTGMVDPTKSEAYQCLVKNAYFEARNQSDNALMTITHVVLNRVADDRFGPNPCAVVYAGQYWVSGHPKRNQCQFSWYCDGRPDDMIDQRTLDHVEVVVYQAVALYAANIDLSSGATHYHAVSVTPYWAHTKTRTTRVDDHIFYRWE